MYSIKIILTLPFILSLAAADVKPPLQPGEVRTYDVRGVVEKLKQDVPAAVIYHEEIPGFMEAMSMTLKARDSKEFEGVKEGDGITFRLNVTAEDGWIDRVHVVAPAQEKPKKEEVAEADALKPIEAGAKLPDAKLVNDRGEPFALKDYSGKALALTFIYTRCPFPTFCPRVNKLFQETEDLLAEDDAPSSKDLRLLSISIEPDRDTPEVLKPFADAHRKDAERWAFATGSLKDITLLTVQCGLDFWDDRGLIQHNLRTIVVDPQGKVTRIFSGEDWKAEELVKELKLAAGGGAEG